MYNARYEFVDKNFKKSGKLKIQYLFNRAWNVNGNMVLYDWNICLRGGIYDICEWNSWSG